LQGKAYDLFLSLFAFVPTNTLLLTALATFPVVGYREAIAELYQLCVQRGIAAARLSRGAVLNPEFHACLSSMLTHKAGSG
jgi:hypothetical protein